MTAAAPVARRSATPRRAAARCLVTGGASGIGAAMVRRFAADGARIALLDRAPDGPGSPRADTELVIEADVTRPGDVTAALEQVERQWGGLDVVLNNAGISVREPCLEITPDSWHQVLDVNLTGAFLVAQAAARLMRRTGEPGLILNTASVSGMVGMPNYLSYNVSKAGLIALTKTMALELAPEIRVNAICPGYVLTPMQRAEYTADEIAACAATLPLRRLADPAEIAGLAAYLASPEAAFATGQSYVLDGGETAGGLASA